MRQFLKNTRIGVYRFRRNVNKTATTIIKSINGIKVRIVSRMFWGRGSLYRNSFHYAITFLSVAALLTGLVDRIQPAQAASEFEAESNLVLDHDLLQQGSSLQTAVQTDPMGSNYGITVHKVRLGENLEQIAAKYEVSADTIRWANIDLIGPFSNYVETGWELQVPQMNGILHKVDPDETLEQIIAKTQGNLFEVREINALQAPDYEIEAGQMIFIPSGTPYQYEGTLSDTMLMDAFEDPLSHPECFGYTYYGGFSDTHNGVDLVKGYGCPIRSVAAGEVKHAGWWGRGGGWTVIIDHGGGVETHYYHGDGRIWVKKGERVHAGQDILYMGNTGNSTGTHLHLSIFIDKVAVDPAYYVPYKIVHPW